MRRCTATFASAKIGFIAVPSVDKLWSFSL